MSIGQIVQVIGAVVDIEFPRDAMTKPTVSPKTALRSKLSNSLATASCVPLQWARQKACAAA